MKKPFFWVLFCLCAVFSSLAQPAASLVNFSTFSYQLSMYNNEKYLYQDRIVPNRRYDNGQQAFIVTIDPKGTCAACKENAARGVAHLTFSMKDPLKNLMIDPLLDSAGSGQGYYPLLTVNGSSYPVHAWLNNGISEYSFDFTLFENYVIELKIYKATIVDNRLRFEEQPGSRLKIIMKYKNRPVFKGIQ